MCHEILNVNLNNWIKQLSMFFCIPVTKLAIENNNKNYENLMLFFTHIQFTKLNLTFHMYTTGKLKSFYLTN